MIRSYSELCKLNTFEERFRYLKLQGVVGEDTFGRDRYLNQEFYHSSEWKSVRDKVIIRDNGCDLGIEGYNIKKNLYIHHMNPVSEADLIHRMDYILDPEYLICVSLATHNAIHYGNDSYLIASRIVERKKGDTCPWIVS